jgi:CRISPR/Cas system-associated protein endoribonuclease Cas2
MSTDTSPSITGKKQDRKPGTFTKDDPRINRAGKAPGSVDPLKEIGRKIAEKRIEAGLTVKQRNLLKKAGYVLEDLSVIEAIMIELASSSNPAKIQMYLERTYGKVANINVNQNSQFDFMKHANKFTDAELEAIKAGADPLDILFAKLPDVEENNNEED